VLVHGEHTVLTTVEHCVGFHGTVIEQNDIIVHASLALDRGATVLLAYVGPEAPLPLDNDGALLG